MSVTFTQFNSRKFIELIVNLRVQSFAGYGAVLQRRKIVFRQVFANEKTEYGRWCTQGGNLVFLNFTKYICRCKFFVIINKYTRPYYPLSVKFAPYGLEPAGIGYGEVQTFFVAGPAWPLSTQVKVTM